MSLATGQRVLRDNYTLRRLISKNVSFELWEADPGSDDCVLIKAWPFLKDEPTTIERNLWDRELRTLYRLASTPEAERHLVTLMDAAVDRSCKAFIIAQRVPGFDRLSDVLGQRKHYGWLSDMRSNGKRADLWRGALQLVQGLAHVHLFRSVHRAVAAENVFLDAALGPSTLRLGGFEWTIRLGEQPRYATIPTSPLSRINASLNGDWRALGLVLSRMFGAHLESVDEDLTAAVRTVRDLQHLTFDERNYLRMLLQANGHGPVQSRDLVEDCQRVIEMLEDKESLRESERLGVVVALRDITGPSELARAIVQVDSTQNATSEEQLRDWVEKDLIDPEVVAVGYPDNPRYFLKGRRLGYKLTPFNLNPSNDNVQPGWNLAFLRSVPFVGQRDGGVRTFPAMGMIRAYTVNKAREDYAGICQRVRSWAGVLPSTAQVVEGVDPRLVFLQRFLEVTNEIERVIRRTEIFPFRLVDYTTRGDYEYAVVEEAPRTVERISLTTTPLTMVAYLTDEDSATRDEVLVYLGDDSKLEITEWIPMQDFWTVFNLPPGADGTLGDTRVQLRRRKSQEAQPPRAGYLRTRGMLAQVELLKRREEAIELYGGHLFLQRALRLPDSVYMDTRDEDLPRELPPVENFDNAKRSALRGIWRTRPIFCLQGPPGTGKTTLVAQILQQIYEDDPCCQVLMTAQAHSAVDHLRDQIQKFVTRRRQEDFEWVAPIAVRFRKPKPDEDPSLLEDAASLHSVSSTLLSAIATQLEARNDPADYVREWLQQAQEDGADGDFSQLVRRSANFVYCTSTAGDLSELAQSHQMFDWSIIEEAGKAHGFDLVLPLETGHRWLLIGDQNQLPPYREKDFLAGLDRLSDICAESDRLRRFWDAMEPQQQHDFTNEAKRWLYFFKELFNTIKTRVVTDQSLLDMLTEQHRMHPDIGDLISQAFYQGRIYNGTVDPETGQASPRVRHAVRTPLAFRERAVVWVDVQRDLAYGKHLNGRRVNPAEVDAIEHLLRSMETSDSVKESLAVLTPYRLQLRELQARLVFAPPWTRWPDGLEQRQRAGPGVFTVDSFQGRQASVVIVSLVRSLPERLNAGDALGFLREYQRINVMMSRAEKLLILVGDWDFFHAHLVHESQNEGQPFAELARLITWLGQAFASGRAVRVSSANFEMRTT